MWFIRIDMTDDAIFIIGPSFAESAVSIDDAQSIPSFASQDEAEKALGQIVARNLWGKCFFKHPNMIEQISFQQIGG